MTAEGIVWTEEDSDWFIEVGNVVTPSRAEQLEMLTSLVPAEPHEAFTAVDLACGAGSLSAALLARFPACRVIALDGSRRMRDQAAENLARFGDRARFAPFDLHGRDWLDALLAEVRCFASSLAIHHLNGAEKRRLFGDLFARLEPGGALLILDLVEPANERARAAYAAAWDRAVREQSAGVPNGEAIYEHFRQESNHYVTPDVDFDMPSGLFEQLEWLRDAGFSAVDCYWLRAGHALYGGYKG